MDRTGYIGGSDIAAILGIAPDTWGSPWSVWATIVGLRQPHEDTERFALGRDLEHGLSAAFNRTTGLYVVGAQTELAHPRHPMFRGHVDGFGCESARAWQHAATTHQADNVLGGVEHKTAFGPVWVEVPAHYQAQAQWYMWLTGLPVWWFSVLFSGFRYQVYELKADRADQTLIAWAAWRFWRDHVRTGIAPPVDGSDATLNALADVYPTERPGSILELDQLADMPVRLAITQWRAARRAAIAATKDANRHRAIILERLGDHEEARLDGQPVLSYRTVNRDGYTVQPTSYRQLRDLTPKGPDQP